MIKQRAAALFIAVGIAGAAAGCGTSGSIATVSPGSPASGSPGPTGSASPDPLRTHPVPFGASQVLRTTPPASPEAGKPVSLPWEFLRLTDGGRRIEISLEYSGCTSFDYVQVVQQTGSVEITVWGTLAAAHAVCPDFEAILRGSVLLDAPLGSRQLLHGPVTGNRSLPPE